MATWKWSGQVQYGTGGSLLVTGSGDPEGVVSAPVGSVFLRGDGGVSTSVYIKEAGGSGDTGWTALGAAGGGSTSLATLSDVNTSSPSNGEVLTYNTGTSKWINSIPVVTNPGLPIGSIQGNNGAAFDGMPGSTIDFVNGTLTIAVPDGGSATQAAVSVVGDDQGNNILDLYVNGGDPTDPTSANIFVDQHGQTTIHTDATPDLVALTVQSGGTGSTLEVLDHGGSLLFAINEAASAIFNQYITNFQEGIYNQGPYKDVYGSVGTAGQVLSSTAAATQWITPTSITSISTVQFAVPDWYNMVGTSGSSVWRESPAAASELWSITGINSGGGGASSVVIQPTSTAAGYVTLTQGSAGVNHYVSFIGSGTGTGHGVGYYGFVKTFKTNISIASTTSMRYWIGMTDKTTSTIGAVFESNNPAANFVGFRYVAGTDTHWMGYCSTDGSNFSTVDTGITPDTTGALHSYSWKTAQGVPGTVNFFIDGVSVGQITTDAPIAATFVGPIAYAESLAGGVTPSFGCNMFYAENFQ